MRIRAALGFNLIDYPGKIAAVAFTPGCNYNCPACHAKQILNEDTLINEDAFLEYLSGVRKWINGVAICGGEPTLEPGLIPFIERLRAEKLAVKLDTNGSSPEVLARLLAGKLADYVAMDVKGPRALWRSITGQGESGDAMIESMRLVARFPRYEFRTTAGPVLRGGGDITFLTAAEIAETAKLILETTGGAGHRYFIQKFVPRKDGLLDSRLEKFPETPGELLEEMRKAAAVYLPGTEIRG